MKQELEQILSDLLEASDYIEGYVDVNDGDYGIPVPNNAMKAKTAIDYAIQRTETILKKLKE